MNGVVLLRAVVDREAPTDLGQIILDAPSLAALCQAIDWRKSAGGVLTGLTVGPQSWDGALREALALGLDSAGRIAAPEDGGLDIAATAAALAAAIPSDTCSVFAGSAATDSGSGLLPAALAGVLDWPLIAGVIRARQVEELVEVEAIAGPGRRHTYRVAGPVVLEGARLSPPPVYAPLARRLAAARATIRLAEPGTAGLRSIERSTFLGYGPGRPRTKHLLKPSAAAKPGDRLSQLMSGGAQRTGSKLSGDSADLARQLAELLGKAGVLPR